MTGLPLRRLYELVGPRGEVTLTESEMGAVLQELHVEIYRAYYGDPIRCLVHELAMLDELQSMLRHPHPLWHDHPMYPQSGAWLRQLAHRARKIRAYLKA